MRRKPEDRAAQTIKFGVELETTIPINCGVEVGGYHAGNPVINGRSDHELATTLRAPLFNGLTWRADSDCSIVAKDGHKRCEFVSPILFGTEGLARLVHFVSFANAIGGTVNPSCGCHVTVGIESILGTREQTAIAKYVRRLVRVARQHTWAIYAQTGTGRHTGCYARQLPANAGELSNNLVRSPNVGQEASLVAQQCGRGIVNLLKAFGANPVIEFRAFAGTLSHLKVLHHVATCLGIVRRAASDRLIPVYGAQDSLRARSAPEAMQSMWRDFGWLRDEPGSDCALGLFGEAYESFPDIAEDALRLARKFESRFPNAQL